MGDTYSRFYWRFIDEFPAVYDDKPTFGWWMTLLVIADGAHPAPAYLPRGMPAKVLGRLVDAGLVELNGGDRFHVKGVAAERTRRSEAARVGGLASARSRFVERPFNLAENKQRREEANKAIARQFDEAMRRLEAGEFTTHAEALEAVRAEK